MPSLDDVVRLAPNADEPVTVPPTPLGSATRAFAAQLAMDLARNRDPATAVAWLAVEDPARPWPKLPGKPVSAGPSYLVWVGREAASVRNEQWPYQIAQRATQPSPSARWPVLAVDPAPPATDPHGAPLLGLLGTIASTNSQLRPMAVW